MAGAKGGWLYVKNWDKFQHYKRRCPPWIKLHRSILSDYAFTCLHDASKAHLILIWIYASNHEGRLPRDSGHLKRALGLKTAPDLNYLIEQGFLVENASNALATCWQSADPEERREEKRGETARQTLKALLKRPGKSLMENPKSTEKNRRIGELLSEGKVEEAAALRATQERQQDDDDSVPFV